MTWLERALARCESLSLDSAEDRDRLAVVLAEELPVTEIADAIHAELLKRYADMTMMDAHHSAVAVAAVLR